MPAEDDIDWSMKSIKDKESYVYNSPYKCVVVVVVVLPSDPLK